MRFVDADALIKTMEGHVIIMSAFSTMIEARAQGQMKQTCIADVANAPTIDAIPVGWLKTQLIDEFYDELIFRWQKEQEAR